MADDMRALRRRADRGDAAAQLVLTVLAAHLDRPDPREALLALHGAAAEAGEVVAQYVLGSELAWLASDEDTRVEAYGWLARAAASGHDPATLTLASDMLWGQVPGGDAAGGVRLLQDLADRGDPSAAGRLALAYEHGERDIAPDPEQAVRRWTACVGHFKGEPELYLAMASLKGRGGPQDPAAAVRWLEAAATRGSLAALVGLAYMHGEGLGVPKDPNLAWDLFVRAEGAKYDVFRLLGVYRPRTRGGSDPAVAGRGWFRLAAGGGSRLAYFALAAAGLHDGPDGRDEAAVWLRRSADAGFAPAQLVLGQALALGWGVAPDAIQAEQRFTAAARSGLAAAYGHLSVGGKAIAATRGDAVDLQALVEVNRPAYMGHDDPLQAAAWACVQRRQPDQWASHRTAEETLTALAPRLGTPGLADAVALADLWLSAG